MVYRVNADGTVQVVRTNLYTRTDVYKKPPKAVLSKEAAKRVIQDWIAAQR